MTVGLLRRSRPGRSARGDAMPFRAQGVSKSFDGVVAVADVHLDLADDEILGLIGPNGAGKTTLVNMLTGFQRPDSGTIELGGVDVSGWGPVRVARAGVARTFQAVRLFEGLTVAENVEVGAIGAGSGRRQATRLAADALSRVGLSEVADLEATAIPFGSERLVGIARALAGRPRFLLLDEPAAGLNDHETNELAEVIIRIRVELQCGILVIEHDMGLIMKVSDRLHVLDSGRTLTSGPPEVVRQDPAVIEAYLGSEA